MSNVDKYFDYMKTEENQKVKLVTISICCLVGSNECPNRRTTLFDNEEIRQSNTAEEDEWNNGILPLEVG